MNSRCFICRLWAVLLVALSASLPTWAREVQCPAVWPGDSPKSPVKDGFIYKNDQGEIPWEEIRHGRRFDDVVYGEHIDLQCHYANGRILFIPLHGEEKECHTVFREHVDSGGHVYDGNIYIRTYCTLNAHDSTDPNQGPFIVTEPLTRHSDILGFRLDMNRNEIEAAIEQLGGFDIAREGDLIREELKDGRKITVQFAPSGRIEKMVIDSFKLPDHDFYHLLQHRFGLTSDFSVKWTGRWKGTDGATLEIKAFPGGPGAPHTVGYVDTDASQQVRLIDATAK
jgi:hypothetical protein